MGDLRMVIEQPAWSYSSKFDIHTMNVCTNTVELHNTTAYLPDGTKRRYRYLPGVLMHEFRHTLGLSDLYSEKYGDKYPGYLMGGSENYDTKVIPSLDIEYVRQVDRNQHTAKPH